MLKQLLQTFRKPSAKNLAQVELEDAQRQLLAAQSSAEYAKSLAGYHQDRITRLTTYLKDTA